MRDGVNRVCFVCVVGCLFLVGRLWGWGVCQVFDEMSESSGGGLL